jgi:phage terminase small subunit
MTHPLTAKRERFCQLVAAGETYTDAYLEAYQKPAGYDRKLAAEEGSRLMAITDVQLRVQELRRPVIRKLQKKFEYTLQKALEQCDEMYQLAYEQANPMAMGKAIALQSKLVKILSDQVEHRHGLLDDASTETLLAMKAEIENRKRRGPHKHAFSSELAGKN